MKPIRAYALLLGFSVLALNTKAQGQAVTGIVVEEGKGGLLSPIPGAHVYWLGTAAGTLTDTSGLFAIPLLDDQNQLVISYIGFRPDTLTIKDPDQISIILKKGSELTEFEVLERQKATEISYLDPIKTELIREKELFKAACCNLSESFETNPAVDVNFTDAVTGTRQIQLLGMASASTQITREGMPHIRGLSTLSGLTATPGTWVESIQLQKGPGSVVNGYESIAGQINVELRKPDDEDRWFINGYLNQMSRIEANAIFANQINTKWSSSLLLHAKQNQTKVDRNEDGFLDQPTSRHLIAMNRWKYENTNGLRGQFGVKGTYLEQNGGQLSFDEDSDKGTAAAFGYGNQIKRFEGWGKVGYVFPQLKYKSIGLQVSALNHQQDDFFGLKEYTGEEQLFYANLIYQTILGNTNHKIRMGSSFLFNEIRENVLDTNHERSEQVPGIFTEYTFNASDRFTAVAGIRGDQHNLYGFFLTPRLHIRYEVAERTVMRASLGRGWRVTNPFIENQSLLASSRNIQLLGSGNSLPYGLRPEVAWNGGLSLTKDIQIKQRKGQFTVDGHYTLFENQVVIDLDQGPQDVFIYNLNGESNVIALQLQMDQELTARLDLRVAFKWTDYQIQYLDKQRMKPLLPRVRGFANIAYETISRWKFDATMQWVGTQRIPGTATNPEIHQREESSPSFAIFNTQVSKSFGPSFEAYVGVENLFNFVQKNPIIAADEPFGPFFDSTLIWGPIFGNNFYCGFRYRLKHKN